MGVRENGVLVHVMISTWLCAKTKKGLWWQGTTRKQGRKRKAETRQQCREPGLGEGREGLGPSLLVWLSLCQRGRLQSHARIRRC